MIERADLIRIGAELADDPDVIWDSRIDAGSLCCDDPDLLLHVQHQALMRAYQARYILLPTPPSGGSIVERLQRHYDNKGMAEVQAGRSALETRLIAPMIAAERQRAASESLESYASALLPQLRAAPENPFIAYLRTSPNRNHHYRNFLLQSSADLLAEASASALGVIGEFGAPQSALFRILIDEFGYGAHGRKHSVLYRAIMRDFGLPDEYNACWPLFDTASLALHNTIHCLFQNPRNVFLQVGFLLFAETAYQRSTHDHFRYLSEFNPQADARYFAEHAHIDLHHARMVVDEVALPLVETYGTDVGSEIIAGAELTRRAFEAAGEQMLATSLAFEAAVRDGKAAFGAPVISAEGAVFTPGAARDRMAIPRLQVGGLGQVTSTAFSRFPQGCTGRTVAS
ncbi:MAG: hypothetical protein JWR59_368 [Brevundimonas sp.]|nr:hypothetical protein [Brevundimonas sp.]